MASQGFRTLPGFVFQNYTTYFFTPADLSSKKSFNMSMGTFGVAFVGTFLSWVLQTHLSCRTIYS